MDEWEEEEEGRRKKRRILNSDWRLGWGGREPKNTKRNQKRKK